MNKTISEEDSLHSGNLLTTRATSRVTLMEKLRWVKDKDLLAPWAVRHRSYFQCICCCGEKFTCFCGGDLKMLKLILSSSIFFASSFVVVKSFILCKRTHRQRSTTAVSNHPCWDTENRVFVLFFRHLLLRGKTKRD